MFDSVQTLSYNSREIDRWENTSAPYAQALAARHDESGVRFFARRALFLRAFQASALVRPICERRLRAFAACGRLFFCKKRSAPWVSAVESRLKRRVKRVKVI